MGRTKIEWCDWVYNPVWGCRNNCPYCYARRVAKRWGKGVCGRDDFEPTWVESNYVKEFPTKPSRIFVNSMSEVAHWEDGWVVKVFSRIREYPEHRFLVLTKRPAMAYGRISAGAPTNLWLGVTVTKRREGVMRTGWMGGVGIPRWFVSIEPMHEAVEPGDIAGSPWVILGAETGNRVGKVEVRREWLDPWLTYEGTAVFMKDSLVRVVGEANMRREFPGGVV